MRHRLPSLLLLLPLAACLGGPRLDGEGVVEYASGEAARPRLRYLDGQVSRLPHCAIKLGNRLNPGVPPVYVNGAPVGFC